MNLKEKVNEIVLNEMCCLPGNYLLEAKTTNNITNAIVRTLHECKEYVNDYTLKPLALCEFYQHVNVSDKFYCKKLLEIAKSMSNLEPLNEEETIADYFESDENELFGDTGYEEAGAEGENGEFSYQVKPEAQNNLVSNAATGVAAGVGVIGASKGVSKAVDKVGQTALGQSIKTASKNASEKLAAKAAEKATEKVAIKGGEKLSAKVAGKVVLKTFAKFGFKAASKAVLAASTLGISLIVEAILVGGAAIINKLAGSWDWATKKLLNMYRNHPKISAVLDFIHSFVGWFDIKDTVLKRSIEKGWITKEEAQEIENKSSLFGDKFANNYTDTEEGTDGSEEAVEGEEGTEQECIKINESIKNYINNGLIPIELY